MTQPLTIWSNYVFPSPADELLKSSLVGHRLILSARMQKSNLSGGAPDPTIREADVVLGQPDLAALLDAPKIKWVHLSSAGYDRYDRSDLREAFNLRGAMLTTSSGVYDEPCAQHALAMMLGLSRQLPQSQNDQRGDRAWPTPNLRKNSFLLAGQTVVILTYGAIANRLIEMLQPFGMKIYAVRREVRGDETVETVTEKDLPRVLALADHVVNILPGGAETKNAISTERFSQMKRGVMFYNIGRGTTVDQTALLAALDQQQVRFAYLDVTTPEPLPKEHPLWGHPHCFITPHTAGGSFDEFERLVRHFTGNLASFLSGKPLENRVI